MQSHTGVNYPYATHGANMHYAPTTHGGATHGHYGSVYYPTATPIAHHSYGGEPREAGYATVQRLWDDLRRPEFNPKDYGAVNNVLMGMQSYPLPITTTVGGGDYATPAPAVNGYFGNSNRTTSNTHAHDMTPFSNLRTKKDLLEINEILQRMMATAYETPNPMMSHSVSNAGQHNVHSISMDNMSDHSSTPVLTPGSTAASIASGHSPPSMHSPTTTQHPAYPTLPSTSGALGTDMVVDSLGPAHGSEVHMRHDGGYLQRAQPAERFASSDVRARSSLAGKSIDNGAQSIDSLLSARSSSVSSGSSEASDDTTTPGREEEAAQGRNFRLLEQLHMLITERLKQVDSEGRHGSDADENGKELHDSDDDMADAASPKATTPDVAYPDLGA